MIWGPKVGITMLLFFVFTFMVIDVGYKAYMSEDVNKSVVNAGKGAVTQSINRGVLRHGEIMTIDSNRLPAFFNEIRSANHSVSNAEQTIYFGDINELPPMLPVTLRGRSEGTFNSFLINEDPTIEHVKMEVIIYEKK